MVNIVGPVKDRCFFEGLDYATGQKVEEKALTLKDTERRLFKQANFQDLHPKNSLITNTGQYFSKS